MYWRGISSPCRHDLVFFRGWVDAVWPHPDHRPRDNVTGTTACAASGKARSPSDTRCAD